MKTYFNRSTNDLIWEDLDAFVQGSVPVKFVEFVEGCGYAIGDRVYCLTDEADDLSKHRALFVNDAGFADPRNVYELVDVVDGRSNDVVFINGAMFAVHNDGSVSEV